MTEDEKGKMSTRKLEQLREERLARLGQGLKSVLQLKKCDILCPCLHVIPHTCREGHTHVHPAIAQKYLKSSLMALSKLMR